MYPTVDILDAEPWELGFQIHQDFLWNIWISLNFYGVFHQDTESLLPTSSSPCLPFSGTAKPKGSAEMRWQHTALLAFGWKVNGNIQEELIRTYTWQQNISNFWPRPTLWLKFEVLLICTWCPANLKNIEIAIVTAGQALSLRPCAVEHMPRGAVGRKNGRTAMEILGARGTVAGKGKYHMSPVVVLRGRFKRYTPNCGPLTYYLPLAFVLSSVLLCF